MTPISNLRKNELDVHNAWSFPHAKFDSSNYLILIYELVLVVFADEFVVEFQDSILELLVGQVLATADQFVVSIVESKPVEE